MAVKHLVESLSPVQLNHKQRPTILIIILCLIIFFLLSLASNIFFKSFFEGIIKGQNRPIATQEWRLVSNGLRSSWGLYPKLVQLCIYKNDYLVHYEPTPCKLDNHFELTTGSALTVQYMEYTFYAQLNFSIFIWPVIFLSLLIATSALLIKLFKVPLLSGIYEKTLRSISNNSPHNITNEAEQMILLKTEEFLKLKQETNFVTHAQQVAHDIRSPLSALEMIITTLHELPEEKRIIIRNAANRIRDIANSLSNQKGKTNNKTTETLIEASSEESQTAILLLPTIESIVTEKRIQHRNQLNINIEFNQTHESYGLFANIQLNEFKRVISNLLNNAIESFAQLPSTILNTVTVVLRSTQNQEIEITITDTGCGIPTDALNQIGERGATFNKPAGSGLGLYHAKKSIESWGGKLEIHSPTSTSKANPGTQVRILLPMTPAPSWFVSKLVLQKETKVIVFDDDQTIHQIWQGRIEQELLHKQLAHTQIETIHLSTPNDLRKYYQEHFEDLDKSIFLMDYEILNEKESGLHLIEELGIQNEAILVTSRYEEPSIRSNCARLGVKLIPKPMAGFVPIVVN